MKSLTGMVLAAALGVSAVLPAMTTDADARRGHRGAAIGAGIALGILGAAAIANSDRAYADDNYVVDDYPDQCSRWQYRCERGNEWACDKYEAHC